MNCQERKALGIKGVANCSVAEVAAALAHVKSCKECYAEFLASDTANMPVTEDMRKTFGPILEKCYTDPESPVRQYFESLKEADRARGNA